MELKQTSALSVRCFVLNHLISLSAFVNDAKIQKTINALFHLKLQIPYVERMQVRIQCKYMKILFQPTACRHIVPCPITLTIFHSRRYLSHF